VVCWLGAVQAQEYQAAKWGLAQRLTGEVKDADIERAFNDGLILRTHVMRPTWHFVARDDIGWMLDLTASRVQRAMGSHCRQLGLDAPLLTRATGIFERALGEHGPLTRAQLAEHLSRAGLEAKGNRLGLITMHVELEQVMCSGPRQGNQFTYALLAHRAPTSTRLSRDEALSELARRFFTSHGPATLRDFAWWSGLTMADGKRGVEINGGKAVAVDGLMYWTLGRAVSPPRQKRPVVRLLPVYDEYLVAYRDREAVPHLSGKIGSLSRGVMVQHALIVGGHVAGTWRVTRRVERVAVDVVTIRKLTRAEHGALADEADRYGRFLGVPVALSVMADGAA